MLRLPPVRVLRDVLSAGLGRLKHPYKLNFLVTKECHSRCVYCRIWQATPKNELSLTEIRRFAQANPFFSWVTFAGGEPTDRKDLVDVVAAFVEYNKNLSILHFPTNGLRPEHIAKAAADITRLPGPELHVTVSIDGPPEENDRLRGIAGDFDLAVETYSRLKNMPRVQAFVGMTIYPSNHDKIAETLAAVQKRIPKFGYKNFHVNLGHVAAHYYENTNIKKILTNEMIGSIRQYRKNRGFGWAPVDILENTFFKLAEDYISSGRTPIACEALASSCFLDETGTVFPCSIWSEPLGNIRTTDFQLMPLITSQRGRQLRTTLQNKECANCWSPCEAYQSISAHKVRAVTGISGFWSSKDRLKALIPSQKI